MKISIFGLGYVGCVSLGCLAKNGHTTIGIDINPKKVDLINSGKPTIVENGIEELIKEQHTLNRISATTEYLAPVLNTEVSIICVGTPNNEHGHLNLDHIIGCAEQIGESLKTKDSFHTVVIRSTVAPGTNKRVSQIIEKVSGKKHNEHFAVVSNPEFLREGSSISDYYNPAVTILGSENEQAIETMKALYKDINGPVEVVNIEVAEIIKYVNNSFHALKISFANEVGNICKRLGIDSAEVMRTFCMDKQLNISSSYLKPGFAYGGSCLPKDLKALNALAHDHYLEVPMLNAIEKSNAYHKALALKMILDTGKSKIGFLGLSFKEGTDDLRSSPAVELIEQLVGKGKQIWIYDQHVTISRLLGANKSYIEHHLPHLATLMVNELEELVQNADVLVIPNKIDPDIIAGIPEEKILIDFCKVEGLRGKANYQQLN